jgi:hypothetical protein
MRKILLIGLAGLFCQACFQEDERVPPHQQGDLEEGVAPMGPLYGSQVYYDLGSNGEAASIPVTAWDLAFEGSTGGWMVRLNTARFMMAGNTEDTLFSVRIGPDQLEMRFDPSSGNPDSTAIGEWYETVSGSIVSRHHVYLLDLGTDAQGRSQGMKKVQFDIQGEDYLIRFADPYGGKDTTVLVRREGATGWIHYSLRDGIIEGVPGPDSWSLLFTRYTTMLVTDQGEDYPYLVTGVLLNESGVTAARDTITGFDKITLADTIGLEMSRRSDLIGYNWKYYNFDEDLYTIVPDYNYVIRDRDGFFYKLRFIDFYNETGEKGYPTFEFVRL